MRNLILILSTILLITIQLSSQTRVGFKAEYGKAFQATESTLIAKNQALVHEISLHSIGNTTSAGIFYRFQYDWLFFQPEIFYTTYTNEFLVSSYDVEVPIMNELHRETFQNLEFHSVAGLKFKFLRICFGPVFNYTMQLDSKFRDVKDMRVKDYPFGTGFLGGIGIDINNLSIDVKYVCNFPSVSQHMEFNYFKFDMESTQRTLRVGVSFTLPTKKVR